MEIPSAMRFAKPMSSTTSTLREAPATAATMLKVVMMPSSPPNTTDLITSLRGERGEGG